MSYPSLSIASPSPPVLRLEHLLEHILQKDLFAILDKRDRCFDAVAQCVHLRQLLCDLHDLGMVKTVLIDEAVTKNTTSVVSVSGQLSVSESSKDYNSNSNSNSNDGHGRLTEGVLDSAGARLCTEVTMSASIPVPANVVCASQEKGEECSENNNNNNYSSAGSHSSRVLQATNMLVDIGQHFYMKAEVPNPAVVWINIGCGVVCPMTHQEANSVLKKKEALFRNQSVSLSKEILRVRFRMRLVKEAICRLQGLPVVN